MNRANKKLLIVSNRLPIEISEDKGKWIIKSSPGGLVTALSPMMRRSRGTWIGWPGCPDAVPAQKLIDELSEKEFNLTAVNLSLERVEKYYRGYANKSIWPLFHDLLGHFSYDPENWQAYQDVNRLFAEVTMQSKADNSFIWVHDYQLLLVGRYLRELGSEDYLRYFLHIPFPSPDLLRRLPHYHKILTALLDYDRIGFQTLLDKNNFIQCVKEYVVEAEKVSGGRMVVIRYHGRDVRLGNFPISIDFDEFNEGAKNEEVDKAIWYLRENMSAEKIIFGLDRLDYTKGIPERFLAFEKLLQKYPEYHGKVSLLQVVIPSRLNVPDYQELKNELDTLSGRINGAFTQHGWVPIHYVFRSLDRVQLLAHYRASDIALITPLRDGMNLVSKEYCASSIDNKGVLVLSEFAGSAKQLGKAAILVNPYDTENTADALKTALDMPDEEKELRMKILRSEVKRNSVQRWINWFLNEEDIVELAEEVTV